MRIMCYLCIGMLLPVPDRPNKTAWCPPPPQVRCSLHSAATRTRPSSREWRWACLIWACPWSLRARFLLNLEPRTSEEKVHAYRTPTTSVNTCSSSLCRPDGCSLFPTSTIHIKVSTSPVQAPKPADVVRGAAWVLACCCYSLNKTEAVCFWCKITANTRNLDCCHRYQAQDISSSRELM